MLNVFEAFLISVTVIPVSVHRPFPLLMSPPDSSDVARKGIEPHITAGVSGHRGAACKKTCTDGQLVLPIHSFCTALTYKLYGLHPRWRCLRWQQELQQKYCFVLLAFTKAYRPLFVSYHFFPAVLWKKAVWVPRAVHFGSTRDLFPPPVTQLPCMQGSTGRAKFPDRPILAQISTSQRHALQELSSHSRVTHFFSVP